MSKETYIGLAGAFAVLVMILISDQVRKRVRDPVFASMAYTVSMSVLLLLAMAILITLG